MKRYSHIFIISLSKSTLPRIQSSWIKRIIATVFIFEGISMAISLFSHRIYHPYGKHQSMVEWLMWKHYPATAARLQLLLHLICHNQRKSAVKAADLKWRNSIAIQCSNRSKNLKKNSQFGQPFPCLIMITSNIFFNGWNMGRKQSLWHDI